jgi:hypothetical protein
LSHSRRFPAVISLNSLNNRAAHHYCVGKLAYFRELVGI